MFFTNLHPNRHINCVFYASHRLGHARLTTILNLRSISFSMETLKIKELILGLDLSFCFWLPTSKREPKIEERENRPSI